MTVTLEMSSLGVMFKRRRKKATKRNRETAAHYCDRKKRFLKILLQNVFEVRTEKSPASLTTTVDGPPNLPSTE